MTNIDHFLYQRHTQELALNPKMLQSLKMLALNQLEFEMQLKEELASNPILEISEEEDELLKQDVPKVEEAYDNKEEEEAESEESEELKQTIEELKEFSEVLDEWADYHRESRGESRSKDFTDYPTSEPVEPSNNEKMLSLHAQLERLSLNPRELEFARELVENIDEYGYLPSDFDIYLLASDYLEKRKDAKEFRKRVDEIHQMIMRLEPKGLTARSVPECLIAQLDPHDDNYSLISSIISEHFEDLVHKRYGKISQKFSVHPNKINDYRLAVMALNPKPGLDLFNQVHNYITPDVIIRRIEDDYVVYVNDTNIPRLTLNRRYRNMIETGRIKDKEFLDYLRKKMKSAKFLIKSIHMRTRTILRVTNSIIEHQKDYFYNYTGILKPMTYSTIANDLGVNASTISRVVKDKFAETPFGIICLKDFFTTVAGRSENYEDVSRQNIQKQIEKIIELEDKSAPLSDSGIAEELRKMNIIVSRRVIVKYREQLGIPNSRLRRID